MIFSLATAAGGRKMTLSNAGNLGIGVIPSAKLDVDGTVNVTGVATFNNHVNLGDEDEIQFDNDNDAKITVDTGQNFVIQGNGTTYLRRSTVNIGSNGGSRIPKRYSSFW